MDTSKYKQTSLKKQLIDQGAHFVAAFVILGISVFMSPIMAGLWLGFWIGLIREVSGLGSQTKLSNFKRVLTSKWKLLDILFWALGGAVGTSLVALYA